MNRIALIGLLAACLAARPAAAQWRQSETADSASGRVDRSIWVRGSTRIRSDHAPALWVRCRRGLPDASVDLGEGLGPGERSMTWRRGEGAARTTTGVPGAGGSHLFVAQDDLLRFLEDVRRGGRLEIRADDALGVTRTVVFELEDAATELDRLGCFPPGYWSPRRESDTALYGPGGGDGSGGRGGPGRGGGSGAAYETAGG
jgi:hypothetical protein